MRVLLLLITNIAIITTFSVFLKFTGLENYIESYIGNFYLLLGFCFIFGMGGSFISLLLSKTLSKRIYNIELLDYNVSDKFDWYRQYVKEISLLNGINPPEIGVYFSPDINAFATGSSKNNSLIAISTGLIENMNLDEIKGVIGHEVAHIANGDMVTMTLLQGVLNSFVLFFSRIIASVISKNEKFSFFVNIALIFVLEIIFGFIALLIINAFSRHREYKADKWCAQKVGKNYMIKALEKLKGNTPLKEEALFSAFRISNNSFFSTHPTIQNRIDKLKNY